MSDEIFFFFPSISNCQTLNTLWPHTHTKNTAPNLLRDELMVVVDLNAAQARGYWELRPQ